MPAPGNDLLSLLPSERVPMAKTVSVLARQEWPG